MDVLDFCSLLWKFCERNVKLFLRGFPNIKRSKILVVILWNIKENLNIQICRFKIMKRFFSSTKYCWKIYMAFYTQSICYLERRVNLWFFYFLRFTLKICFSNSGSSFGCTHFFPFQLDTSSSSNCSSFWGSTNSLKFTSDLGFSDCY